MTDLSFTATPRQYRVEPGTVTLTPNEADHVARLHGITLTPDELPARFYVEERADAFVIFDRDDLESGGRYRACGWIVATYPGSEEAADAACAALNAVEEES